MKHIVAVIIFILVCSSEIFTQNFHNLFLTDLQNFSLSKIFPYMV